MRKNFVMEYKQRYGWGRVADSDNTYNGSQNESETFGLINGIIELNMEFGNHGFYCRRLYSTFCC